MSLIMHYPFINNTEDTHRGVNTPMVSGIPTKYKGKLGECLEINNTIDTDITYDEWGLTNTSHSFGGWFYFDEEKIKEIVNSFEYNDTRYTFYCTILGYNTYGGSSLGFRYDHKQNEFQVGFFFRTYYTTTNIMIPLEFNKWIHLYCIYDLNLNGDCSINFYKNKELIEQKTMILDINQKNNNPNTSFINNFMINKAQIWSGNSYSKYLPIRMNDIRLYNHALSTKEIDNVYKTKVCHYRFNYNFQNIEPEINAVFNSDDNTGGFNHWGGSSCSGKDFGISNDGDFIYKNIGKYSHWITCTSGQYLVYKSIEKTRGNIPRSFQAIIKDSKCRPITNDICFPTWNTNISTNNGAILNKWTSITPLEDDFYLCKCELIIQRPSNIPNDWLLGIYVTGGNKIYISKILQEQSQVCSDIFNSNPETLYDLSGFNQHIPIPRNSHCPELSKTNNKNRYSMYAKFYDNFGIKHTLDNKPLLYDECTMISVLQLGSYHESTRSMIMKYGAIYLTIITDGYISVYGYGKQYTGYHNATNKKVPLNKWCVITSVWSNDETVKIYLNKELIGTFTTSGLFESNSIGRRIINIGREDDHGRQLNGYISENIVYGTAFTQKDINDICDDRLTIDNKGNINCLEYKLSENIDDNIIYNGYLEKNNRNGYQLTCYSGNKKEYINEDKLYNNGCIYIENRGTIFNNYYIPINSGDIYLFEIWLKNGEINKKSNFLTAIQCYDKDKKFISRSLINYYSNTETYITSEVNDGDLYININDSTNWQPPQSEEYKRYIGIFDLPEFPNYKKARLCRYYTKIENNKVYLKSPWDGGQLKTNTKVANCKDGGTYIYPHSGTITNDWKKYSRIINDTVKFKPGTKYIKIGVLGGRDTDNSWEMGGLILKNLSNPQSKSILNNEGKTININKLGTLKSNNIYEIGMPIRYIRNWIQGSTANINNHWVQIEAYNEINENIILGKPCTILNSSKLKYSNTYLNDVLYYGPYGKVTDGKLKYNRYVWADTDGSSIALKQGVQIDIGFVSIVQKIKLWHYYADERIYHNNIVEVSMDGENWIIVFDSNKNIEYKETSEGKTIWLKNNEFSIDNKDNIYTNSFSDYIY